MAGGSGARTRKTRTLQDLFRPPLDLIYKGTFANARETGKTQGRWLMVNIQNVQEFSCQALNRDIWSNSAVKALIKDSFIFWQVYHDSEEGQRYRQFYKVEGWPYVAVLDPTTGENLISWNKIQPVTFCDIIVEFLKKHPHIEGLSPTQPNKRQKREDSLMEASEDDQLQAAITASLTHLSKCQSVHTPAPDTDSDISDLETFTDSSDDAHSPHKTRARRSSGNQGSPVKGAPCGSQSPTPRRSPRSQSDSDDECNVTCDRAKRTRKQSPLATQTSNEISDKNKKAQTPRKTRNVSPLTVVSQSCQSPSKGSPSKKHNSSPSNPQPSCSPAKSKSIHNDVHPAVIDNIRRTSLSEDEDSRNVSEMTETSGTSEPVESDRSLMDVAADRRDYRKFLGPETDEKMTLMLRLPDGERDKLTLAVSSQLLAVVLYVGSRGYSNERYELVTHFPRRHLSTLDFDSSLRDVGLHTQETVFIQART
ncbi:UBX domain-containing protein 7-like isoform X2 [Mya arenaria]|nr:UBX domain-containing protein 7-like isoform X2 [Mya arenaria]